MTNNERMVRILQTIAINTQKHDASRIRHYMMSVLDLPNVVEESWSKPKAVK
jgi:hypothetical protein